MHIECPKHIKFCMPFAWMTTLTEDEGTPRQVMSSRYENVTIIDQPNYLVCCGAIKGQGEDGQKGHMKGCHKAAVMSAQGEDRIEASDQYNKHHMSRPHARST